ncbi:endoribonuclease [Rhodococcus opacus M213]|uniref:Endoribonuclease n=2 Tax=Rhodococcus opacus TaxID=37919 RepID=K8XV38_RHOOP|nr:RidA family protein [Rhodococcus opacus]ANS31143.1 endoribonuclease [Rhodococcus opacus]EKT84791.1 endoribonuclease [Rhodococcus opacus M213]
MTDVRDIADRLHSLGITLPTVPTPVAAYLPAVRSGSYIYTSGQLPLVDGVCIYTGKVGGDVTVEHGMAAAKLCTVNGLAAVHDLVGLDRILRVVKMTGFVSSAEGFTKQSQVINGASDLLIDVFSEAGRHARSAIGVAELPRGSAVEAEFVFEINHGEQR